MFYRSTYIVIDDDWEPIVVGNWTKLKVNNFVTTTGTHFMALRHGEFDCINTIPCGYFYAAIVAICLPSLLCGIAACILFNPCCFPFGLLFPPLLPLAYIAGKS